MGSHNALLDEAARPYRAVSKYAWYFAKGKLRHDPAYFSLLRLDLLPARGSLLDVGCGQGLLFSLLAAARKEYAAGRWPSGWPAPPAQLTLHGVDANASRVRLAREALQRDAQIHLSDLRGFDFPRCAAIVMLDVLLFLPEPDQEAVLERAAAALEPGGRLLMREPDAGAGLAFHVTRLSAWFDAAARGEWGPQLYCRSATRWASALAQHGLAVESLPMDDGTPFSNVLFSARKVV